MRPLRDRNIKNTLFCTQLNDVEEKAILFVKPLKPQKTIAQLIQDGFEYVCDQQNLKFF
jgi:hypothetical protein